jgi:4-hydroxy-2-oxoheptanedioate aldolase
VANTLPIVKVKENIPSFIKEILDIGAGGIHVPQITDAEAAKEVIELAKFAPEGMRGVCRFCHSSYSEISLAQ